MRLFFALLVALILFSCKQQDAHVSPDILASITKSDDPFAKYTYEFDQLKSPITGAIPDDIFLKEQMYAKTITRKGKNNDDLASLDWQHRGPYFVGGRTRAFAFDVRDDSVIMTGSVSGGIWRSEDAGDSWTKQNTFGNNISVTVIAQDPRPGHQDEWYYGTGEAYGASQALSSGYYGSGIFRSTDNGQSWSLLPSFDPGSPIVFNDQREAIYKIMIDPTQDDLHLYVATLGAIYRSIDGGESWAPTLITPLGQGGIAFFVDLEITSDGVFYASMSNENKIIGNGVNNKGGVWRSEDGVSWTRIIDETFPNRYNRIDMTINPHDQDELYMIIGDVSEDYGRYTQFGTFGESYNAMLRYNYISGDGTGAGGEWTNLTANVPTGSGFIDGYHTQGGYDMAITVHPTDQNTIYIAGTNVYRSTDGFTSSDNTSYLGGYDATSIPGNIRATKEFHPDIHGMTFRPSDPNTMYVYSDGGVYKTDDALADDVSWTSLNNGYLTTQLYTVYIDPADPDRLMGGSQDDALRVVSSPDAQAVWAKTLFGDGSFGSFSSDRDEVILSTQLGRIIKARIDESNEIVEFERIDPQIDRSRYLFIHPLELDPNDDQTLYLPVGRELMVNTMVDDIPYSNTIDSSDLGWHIMRDTLDDPDMFFTSITAPANAPGTVYLGTNDRKLYRVDDAANPDAELIDITPLQAPVRGYLRCITVDQSDADQIMIAYVNYDVYSIFLTMDGGESWSRVAGNLEQFSTGRGNGPSVKWVGIQTREDESKVYWAGTSTGLYYATDIDGHGTQWTIASPDFISNNIVSMIKTHPQDNLIVVATHGNGVFSANLPAVQPSSTKPIVDAPELKIHPNPASNIIQVSSDDRYIGYRIYDAVGRIMDDRPLTGNAKRIDISRYTAGLYYLELINSDGQKVIKDFVKQ